MNRIKFINTYDDIISIENLLEAWGEFVNGKRQRKDVQEFGRNLMGNIISLHKDLSAKTYTHSSYEPFTISDPKFREIHKASVRDRLLHHAIYRKLHTFFDKTFIPDSYSCRLNKGTHKAMARFKSSAFEVSKNHTKTVWVLKCDIRKFFASIDQKILLEILRSYISDENIFRLLSEIIGSFHSARTGVGLPLGNLTSQLFVNIYMNEFDQFMKHKIKAKYYIRYADDFVILDQDRGHLIEILPQIAEFLGKNLKLSLHPDKVFIKTSSSGVDFLGWIHFSDHRIVRKVTERRMIKNISKNQSPESLASYRGLLLHGNTYKLKNRLGFI